MVGALSDDARLTSVCCVHGPKSRTERPNKTKIGIESQVTHDSDTTFKVKRSKGQRSTCRGRGILWRPPAQLVSASYSVQLQLRYYVITRIIIKSN